VLDQTLKNPLTLLEGESLAEKLGKPLSRAEAEFNNQVRAYLLLGQQTLYREAHMGWNLCLHRKKLSGYYAGNLVQKFACFHRVA
jgi:hypothetical protein